MVVYGIALALWLIALAVVLIPGKQRHIGGRCTGLWFNRRIEFAGVPPGRIDYCLRHERAHAQLWHMEKLLVAYGVALLVGAVVANMTPHPVIVFMLLGAFANYGTGRLVKRFEKQADKEACRQM